MIIGQSSHMTGMTHMIPYDSYQGLTSELNESAILFLEQMNRILETQSITVDYSLTKVKINS